MEPPSSNLPHPPQHASLDTTASSHISSPVKRPRVQTDLNGHVSKRLKSEPEEPEVYSENVRKKLAATSRTGQACDRCKERKMKCDPDPVACQPCRQKNLKCYTTDRVTGKSRERGQDDRADNEAAQLREQLAIYQKTFGTLSDVPITPHTVFSSPARDRQHSSSNTKQEPEHPPNLNPDLPSSQYVGWPVQSSNETLHQGPVELTKANIVDWPAVDSGGFQCDLMQEPPSNSTNFFNMSTGSILNTIYQRQRVYDPILTSKKETLKLADIFLSVMWSFVPMVHKPSFYATIHRLYDNPSTITWIERIQIVQMLAIVHHQTSVRNLVEAYKFEHSHRNFHYCLGFWPDLMTDNSLAAMQALAIMMVHFRNFPKPGHTWELSQQVLMRCIDLNYHREPDKLELPPEQNNVLAKELRKRVFHTIFGIVLTTGARLGKPSPWQFMHIDVPLPIALKDNEVSADGLKSERSGQCDFWPCIQLSKMLPLINELYNQIYIVRRSPADYLKTCDALRNKVEAWRADWDTSMLNEDKDNGHNIVTTLLVDTWAHEFLLLLHHPSVCAAKTPDVQQRNLEICHRAAKKMLSNFHRLSTLYKAADFTWHCVVNYTLAFGITLHIYKSRTGLISTKQYDDMRNELAGWLSLMATTDLVLRTDGYLKSQFRPIVVEVQNGYDGRVTSATQPNPPSHRSSLSNVNTEANKADPSITQESYSIVQRNGRSSYDLSLPTNGDVSNPSFPHSPSTFGPASPFANPHTTVSPASYPMSSSPPVVHYPGLSTSLAPLMNDGPPMTMAQTYRPPAVTGPQEIPMVFQPQLYTDNAVIWPLIPGEGFQGQ